MHTVSDLTQLLIARPDFWPVAFWVPFFLVLWFWVRMPFQRERLKQARWLWPTAGLLLLVAFGCFWLADLRSPVYPGPIQPQVAEVSWYFAQGRPVYHSPATAETYNMLYGPNLYIITGWF